MTRWVLLVLLSLSMLIVVPPVAQARRCGSRCRKVTRQCKLRCKAAHPRWRSRHRCYDACKARHLRCRARCG